MTSVAQTITLSGSVATVVEYFGFAINSILYQRGVYPADDFQQVKKYGLSLMISTHEELNAYLAEMLQQIAQWVSHRSCRRVALILVDLSNDAVLERWEFNIIDTDSSTSSGAARKNTDPLSSSRITLRASGLQKVSEEQIREEISAVMRQITSSISFLPSLPAACAFDLLVYTAMDAETPPSETWEPSEPRNLEKGSQVRLRSFYTGHHAVDTHVAYRD